jgi:hypothetical protein
VSALENRFRRIKSDAKALNDALAAGIDPLTIPTDSLNGKIGGGKGRLQPKPGFSYRSNIHILSSLCTHSLSRRLLTMLQRLPSIMRTVLPVHLTTASVPLKKKLWL